MREYDTACVFHLIEKKFPEILQIHFTFLCVYYRAKRIEAAIGNFSAAYRFDDVGKLSDAGRFDQNTIGRIFRGNLFQCLCEIAHERTANATGIHFGDPDSCVLQEASVYADFPEFVLDQHDVFADIGFPNQFLNQRRFSRTQKTGKNVD